MWLMLGMALAIQNGGLSEQLQACADTEDSLERLACYDELARGDQEESEPSAILPPANIDVAGALARGLDGKSAGLELSDTFASLGGVPGFRLQIHSPKTWVQELGYEASKKYMTVSPADLAPEDTQNCLRVVVFPATPDDMSEAGLASDVEHVVVQDADKEQAVQPLLMEPFTESLSNLFGAQLDYDGITAVFDMSEVQRLRELDSKREFHVTVVGSRGEKSFKVKTKHFDDLGWQKP